MNSLTALLLLLSLPLVEAGPAFRARYTIETADAIHRDCELNSFDEKGIEGAGGDGVFKSARVLELHRAASRLPAPLTRDFVLLTTGDRIRLDAGAGAVLEENRLVVWPAKSSFPAANTKGLSLYLPHVCAALWSLPEGIDDADLFVAQLLEESRKRDVIFLKNGDRIEGALTNLTTRTGSVVAVGTKRIESPWAKIAGLALSTERAVRPRTKKPYARVVFEDGSRVSFQDLRLDARTRQFTGKTLFGAALEFPETALVALDVHQDLATDLSELTPSQYEQRPFLGASWPLARDAAATGHPLRLAGSTFEKGVGVHAPARVTYKLDGQFERFDALVGIDEIARRGRARIALELDGKRIDLNDGKELSAKDAAVIVRQNVRGARELTLIVEAGAFGDVQANVNWAKARLLFKK